MSALMKKVEPPPIPKRKSEPPPIRIVERVIHEPAPSSSLGSFGFLVGVACGYAFAYMILLEPIELLGHSMFWNAVKEGRVNNLNLDTVIHSSSFTKLVISSAIGGAIGGAIGSALASVKNR